MNNCIPMRPFSDLLPFRVTAGDKIQQVALMKVGTPPSSFSHTKRKGKHRGKGESLAAGVVAVFSGIHYLVCLKIHQRLPPFLHMVNLNFTASNSKLLGLMRGAASSTVHQGMCTYTCISNLRCKEKNLTGVL